MGVLGCGVGGGGNEEVKEGGVKGSVGLLKGGEVQCIGVVGVLGVVVGFVIVLVLVALVVWADVLALLAVLAILIVLIFGNRRREYATTHPLWFLEAHPLRTIAVRLSSIPRATGPGKTWSGEILP